MKKGIILLTIISVLLISALAGCRAVEQAPGVTAIQSALNTLAGISPSPVATAPMGTAGVLPTTPMATGTLGAGTTNGGTAP